MMREMKGVCFLHSETGTEGGWWAIQKDGFGTEEWGWRYEGMQYLEEGDDSRYLTTMEVFWHGIIHPDLKTGRIPPQVIRKDRAAHGMDGKFPHQSEVEAALRDTMGQTYFGLWQYKSAQVQFQRAAEIYEPMA